MWKESGKGVEEAVSEPAKAKRSAAT
jgi:hypothetical protein